MLKEIPQNAQFKKIGKAISSKDELFFTMAYRAQLALPPQDRCSLEFMGQILKGKKKAIKNRNMVPVRVSNRTYITVDKVLKQIRSNPKFMVYLPDKPKTAGRTFIFNVVNTIDPTYFPSALEEIEHLHIAKTKKSKDEFIECTQEM